MKKGNPRQPLLVHSTNGHVSKLSIPDSPNGLPYRNGARKEPAPLPYSLPKRPVGRPEVRSIGTRFQTYALALKEGQMAKLRQIALTLGIFHGPLPSAQKMIRMIAEGEFVVVPRDRIINIDDFHLITGDLPPEEAPPLPDEVP